MSLSAPVWIGRNLSYGMYLWHYPVIRLLHDLGVVGDALLPAGLAATFVAALASYALVERPLLRRGRPSRAVKADLAAAAVRPTPGPPPQCSVPPSPYCRI
ncbi:hypothetical protein [Streptomyces sp. NPDC001642]|uniref:acyltransferase family protein n=1 Tax=Streptomyces sp. NPDC001642 TaxID=3154392 RepID=UPI0033220676